MSSTTRLPLLLQDLMAEIERCDPGMLEGPVLLLPARTFEAVDRELVNYYGINTQRMADPASKAIPPIVIHGIRIRPGT